MSEISKAVSWASVEKIMICVDHEHGLEGPAQLVQIADNFVEAILMESDIGQSQIVFKASAEADIVGSYVQTDSSWLVGLQPGLENEKTLGTTNVQQAIQSLRVETLDQFKSPGELGASYERAFCDRIEMIGRIGQSLRHSI